MDFMAILGCETHFKSELLRANCAKISRDRQGQAAIEILALNIDVDSLSLDFLGSMKPVH